MLQLCLSDNNCFQLIYTYYSLKLKKIIEHQKNSNQTHKTLIENSDFFTPKFILINFKLSFS